MPQKPDKFAPALYGGILMGVLSATPYLSFVNCLCCAGILLGGFMSVFFYKKELTADMETLTSSDGMTLGAFAGLFGAVTSGILEGLFFLIFGNIANEASLQTMQSMGVLDRLPPEALEQIEQGMLQQGFSIVGVIVGFIICPLFGLLGGLIGYAVFRKRSSE
jgi:hypothetical protein